MNDIVLGTLGEFIFSLALDEIDEIILIVYNSDKNELNRFADYYNEHYDGWTEDGSESFKIYYALEELEDCIRELNTFRFIPQHIIDKYSLPFEWDKNGIAELNNLKTIVELQK